MTNIKLKNLIPIWAIILLGKISFAQSITPQLVNCSGSKMIQSNGSISFTVGELVVSNQTDSLGNTLAGGFSGCSTLTTVSIQEIDTKVLDINLFPNPAYELVNIRVNYSSVEQFNLTIKDLQGKEIYIGTFAGISNTIGINTSGYSCGTYILSFKNMSNQILGTYKIIKN